MNDKVENNEVEVKYAGFWIRLLARFLDGIVVNAAMAFILLAFHQRYSLFSSGGSAGASLLANTWQAAANTLALWVYNILMLKYYNATLGKMVLGLKVVGDGKELDLLTIILRETVGKLVSEIILLIGFLMVAWDVRKQGVHDKIAGTLVIKES